MPGRINDEDIQALRERADLAAVVGDYTALRRAGSRLKGLCPFHEEKTPSFTVDPARNLFHCFGCDEGGDVYAFLQKIEALSFPEAVERLARINGYSLRYEELSPGQRKALGRRTRLSEALGAAHTFYRAQLAADAGRPGLDYLTGRGLSQGGIDHFGLGWAPDEWDGLSRHLQQEGFTTDEIMAAGLATRGQRGPVDRFRGRIMFPIFDPGGRDVVAFGGRIVPELALRTAPRDGQPPKYINSSETEVYKKSRTLYGLNWARADIQRRDTVLVVEGYMDVIGLHAAGVRHAVATCGTALTEEHFRQLEKFARRVVLALDADQAGFRAADRARELAERAGMREVGVLGLPDERDPADLAAEGAEAVERALRETKTAVQFQIEFLLREADMSSPEGQIEAYRRTFDLLRRIDDPALRYRYIWDVVAPAVQVPAARIEAELEADLAKGPASRPPTADRDQASRVRVGDLAAATPTDPQMILERNVLFAAVAMPELLPDEWDELSEEDFRAPLSRQLFAVLGKTAPGNLEEILAALPDDQLRARVRALALSDPMIEPERGKVAELVARLRLAALQRQVEEVKDEMLRLAELMSPERRRELMARQYELERRAHELRDRIGGAHTS